MKVIRMKGKPVTMISRTVQLPKELWEALDLIVGNSVGQITLEQAMESAIARHVSSVSAAYLKANAHDLAGKLMDLNLPYLTKLVQRTDGK